MIKLFLAEDETVMREGIKKHIDWEKEGIEFAGEAGDGEIAYPMILNLKPDILITDIKMPFMDGLQLIELVKKELPDLHVIILSGYDDFSYAQKAITLGASEYLLKPISPSKLLETVRKVAAAIQAEHPKGQTDWTQEELEEKEELSKNRLFNAMIMTTGSVPELIASGKELGIDLTMLYFRIMLLDFRIKGEERDAFSETRNAFRMKLYELANGKNGLSVVDRGVDGFFIFQTGNNPEEMKKVTEETVGSIQEMIREYDRANYYMGIGSLVNRLREVRHSYETANRAFSNRFLTGPNKVMYSGEFKENLRGDDSVIDISQAVAKESSHKALENFLNTGTYDEAEPFMDRFFISAGEMNVKSTIFLQYLTVDAYLLMVRFLQQMGENQKQVDEVCGDLNSTLSHLGEWEDSKKYLTDYLRHVIRLRDSGSARKYGKILGTTLNYIDSHYTDPDISLNTVASVANLSPNHFSAIFSQEMKITFIEYLIGKRMEKAKSLLMTTDIRSSEIAYEVGYKDPHYFSHTFKKTQGMSPKEFRMRGKDGNEE